MDVSTVIRKAGRRFGDSNNVIIKEQDFFDFINEAQEDICRHTGIIQVTSIENANSFPWTMPLTLIELERVIYGEKILPRVTVEALDEMVRDSVADVQPGEPLWFYTNIRSIYLYPTADSTDETQVSIQFTAHPTNVSSIANDLSVPAMYHNDIVTWCVMRCHEMNQNWTAKQAIYDEYRANMGTRLEEAQQIDDTYPVIRDDPADGWGAY
jgi:hypothetical protein